MLRFRRADLIVLPHGSAGDLKFKHKRRECDGHQTNISTLQGQARSHAWFPGAYEVPRRTRGDRCAPRQRSGPLGCVRKALARLITPASVGTSGDGCRGPKSDRNRGGELLSVCFGAPSQISRGVCGDFARAEWIIDPSGPSVSVGDCRAGFTRCGLGSLRGHGWQAQRTPRGGSSLDQANCA